MSIRLIGSSIGNIQNSGINFHPFSLGHLSRISIGGAQQSCATHHGQRHKF